MLTPNDKIKHVLKTAGDLALLLSDVAQGFSFREVTLVIGLISDLRVNMQDMPFLFDQYKQLDEESRQDLYAYIEQNIKFPDNTNVEIIVDKVFETLISASVLFRMLN